MAGICFRRESDRNLQDQWSWVFSNFGITEIWQRGFVDDDAVIYQGSIHIDLASELPSGRPLILLAHPEGRYIQGTESLTSFVHPADAIYLFGASHVNLSVEDDLGGRTPDNLVYIPYVQYEMYSYAAAYITLYDRYVKRGSFD